MIRYCDLVKTIEMVSQYLPDGIESGCYDMRGEHDEIVIDIPEDFTAAEIRELARMGWLLGCDAMYDEYDTERWNDIENIPDDELVDMFRSYGCVYMLT